MTEAHWGVQTKKSSQEGAWEVPQAPRHQATAGEHRVTSHGFAVKLTIKSKMKNDWLEFLIPTALQGFSLRI